MLLQLIFLLLPLRAYFLGSNIRARSPEQMYFLNKRLFRAAVFVHHNAHVELTPFVPVKRKTTARFNFTPHVFFNISMLFNFGVKY